MDSPPFETASTTGWKVVLAAVDERRRLHSESSRAQRAALGQFFTPMVTARFMAGMATGGKSHIHVLDAGAGVGSLSAAVIAELTMRPNAPSMISVTCYELDGQLIPPLNATLAECARTAAKSGVEVSFRVLDRDFIEGAVAVLDSSLFQAPPVDVDLAILNPPYLKLAARSGVREQLQRIGIDAGNMYAAFLALAARLLSPGGELIAITPRSFFNGPYFRVFREQFLEVMGITRIHSFSSRGSTFREDSVLQENVILQATRGLPQKAGVTVSESVRPGAPETKRALIDSSRIIRPDDDDRFIRLILSDSDNQVAEAMHRLPLALAETGLGVSTGPVVDFRSREYLRSQPESGTVPLIYPGHLFEGRVNWPRLGWKKPNAFAVDDISARLLLDAGPYVLVKRFSAREEPRRIVAAVLHPNDVPADRYALENHLNYFHSRGKPLDEELAWGLAAFLNSSQVDAFFRQFSGHTQVNATDLRGMRYPTPETLRQLGRKVRVLELGQDDLDATVQSLILAA